MSRTEHSPPRYIFGAFTVSPTRRLLLRGGSEIPLIPRYFDLLLLLLERRGEAISRRDILQTVWSDVVVSDGALSQAVRILRRALGDDSREPVFIRTVPRHGYRFVFPDVTEASDAGPLPVPVPGSPTDSQARDDAGRDPLDGALEVLLGAGTPRGEGEESEVREAAEKLHALGTAAALDRLDRRKGFEAARAFLRDSRWDVPGAGPVPLLGRPGGFRSARILFGLRLRRAFRLAGRRWAAAALGGALSGLVAGMIGGLLLRFGPGSVATHAVLVALPVVGIAIGGIGAAGVAAGLCAAEVLIRSTRGLALVLCGALGGGLVGAAAHLAGRWTLQGLFGRDLSPLAGGFEGLVIGGAAGLGYALSTPRAEGGMAAPHGWARARAVVVTGLICGTAAALLGWTGSHLGAMSLDFLARSLPGSQVGLEPLARLLGEQGPGPMTRTVISGWEGLMFGLGVVAGLTRRPA